MDAEQWRQKGSNRGIEDLTLPSGMIIRARRPGPLQFAQWGRLPLLLASASSPEGASNQDVVEMTNFMRELLIYCCVEPRVSETAAPDSKEEIQPREIPEEDWTFILSWAMRAKEALGMRPFRGQRDDVGTAGDGGPVLMQTVAAASDGRPGNGAGTGPGGGTEAGAGREGRR
jgi:hypothetical protein